MDADAPGWVEQVTLVAERARSAGETWPTWCLVPIAAPYAVAQAHGLTDVSRGVGLATPAAMTALYAWGWSRSIWRFDADLGEALARTPTDAEIPVDVLWQLPEWCVYIESSALGNGILGAFAHLEWDTRAKRPELRIAFDVHGELLGVPVHLDEPTVPLALAAADAMAREQARALGIELPDLPGKDLVDLSVPVARVVAHIMYIVSQGADVETVSGPPPRLLHGPALRAPVVRRVGYRVGQAIRRRYKEHAAQGGTHASPAAHMRRAHWHHFWTGPRSVPSERRLVLRWVHPVLVGAGEVEPVIRTVRDPRPARPTSQAGPP